MGVLGLPDVKLVGNALFVHDPIENLVLAEALVVPACGQHIAVLAKGTMDR